MKSLLRTLFSPILAPLESGEEPYLYKKFQRTVLLFISIVFCGLASAAIFFMPENDMGYWFPVIIFGGVGITGLIVGFFGNERAVAKIWGTL